MAEAILTPNVTSLIHNVLEINATDLTTKNITEKAVLYKQGIRALKVINNDTIVLLGLQDNGSTEWLGSNKPLNNLLDNSDFTNPVNQRGQNDYSISPSYAIDRWIFGSTNSGILNVQYGDARLYSPGEGYTEISQIQPNSSSLSGKNMTFATRLSDDVTTISMNFTYGTAKQITAHDGLISLIHYNNDRLYIRIGNAGSQWIGFKWAALYEGAYTADTLPPYTPKGYAEELAECQRYYENSWYGASKAKANPLIGAAYTASRLNADIYFRQPKRAIPTVSLAPAGNATAWQAYKGSNYRDFSYTSVRYSYHDGFVFFAEKGSADTTTWEEGDAILLYGNWEASADL